MTIERSIGLLFVLVLHAAVLWGLWQLRLLPATNETSALLVNFIAAPASAPEKKEVHKLPLTKPLEKPQLRQFVAEAPVLAPADYVAPPPAPKPMPVIETPYAPSAAPAPPKLDGPVSLGGELSVACPERTAPRYPSASRRMGEEGTVVLRVELDEAGHVTHARVQTGSGHARLDETAIATVQTWRCTPALRDGRPVRAIALQPFKFVLQGN